MKVIKISLNEDQTMKFIQVMHLKRALMPFDYNNLNLKYLDKLRQEVEKLEQKILCESKTNKDD